MTVIRDILKLVASNTTVKILSFIFLTFFARELGPSQIGIFFLFQALFGFLAIPANLGFGGAIVKRVSEGEDQSDIIASAGVVLFLSTTIVALGIVAAQEYINSYLGAPLAVFLALAVTLREPAKFSLNVLKGELRVGETAPLVMARQLTYLGVAWVLVSFGWGTKALVYGLISGLIVVTVLGWKKCSIPFGQPSFGHVKSLVDYSKHGIFFFVDSYAYNWLDIAILGIFLTSADIGAYEIAWRVASVVMVSSIAIEQVILPQISNWDTNDSVRSIQRIIPNAILGSVFFVIPAFFGVLALSDQILGIVFGSEYVIASTVLVILVAGKIVESVDRILKSVLSGMDRPDLRAKAVIISGSLNLCLNVLLIWQIGLVGAAIATTASFASSTAIMGYYVLLEIDLSIPAFELGWIVIASTVMYLCLTVVTASISISSAPILAAVIVLGGIIYCTVVLLSSSLRGKFVDNFQFPLID